MTTTLIRILLGAPDGFTYDVALGVVPQFGRDEYIVSLFGWGARFRRRPSIKAFRAWLHHRASESRKAGRYIGGWLNPETGEYHLDLSIVVRDRINAMQIARQQRQIAIYHPASGQSVSVATSSGLVTSQSERG